jgi:hypothetical protein
LEFKKEETEIAKQDGQPSDREDKEGKQVGLLEIGHGEGCSGGKGKESMRAS